MSNRADSLTVHSDGRQQTTKPFSLNLSFILLFDVYNCHTHIQKNKDKKNEEHTTHIRVGDRLNSLWILMFSQTIQPFRFL